MKILLLFWKLLRYRVAVMLLLFLLLSAALHKGLNHHPWLLLAACIALGFSYVSASSSNDLADQKIDAINHPESAGRPLITGNAKNKDMWLMFGLASAFSILACSLISWTAVAVICCSILINVIYSLPPPRLSYRTFLAPLVLGIAYVGVPYTLALAVVGTKFSSLDSLWLPGLYIMFIGRILLKDFRDRKGDAKYNKPTFLLKFGKNATCLTSGILILIGGLLIILQVRHQLWLVLIVVAYIASILFMLRRLQTAAVGKDEQVSIGVGAKMGNGLLITLLCAFALKETTTSTTGQVLISLIFVALFFGNYFKFLSSPDNAVIGYKG